MPGGRGILIFHIQVFVALKPSIAKNLTQLNIIHKVTHLPVMHGRLT